MKERCLLKEKSSDLEFWFPFKQEDTGFIQKVYVTFFSTRFHQFCSKSVISDGFTNDHHSHLRLCCQNQFRNWPVILFECSGTSTSTLREIGCSGSTEMHTIQPRLLPAKQCKKWSKIISSKNISHFGLVFLVIKITLKQFAGNPERISNFFKYFKQ